MEIKRNTVYFELDDETLDQLKLSLNILKKDPDQMFKEFINHLSMDAFRKMRHEEPINKGEDSDIIIEKRIKKWAESKKSVNYYIIKSYFLSEAKHPGYALKYEMENMFNEASFVGFMFLGNFRGLCSESQYSRAQVFNYDKTTQQVTLCDKVKELVLSLKDDFLN